MRHLRNALCRLGLHQRPTFATIAPRCDWCGHRSRRQRAIAAANYARMDAERAESVSSDEMEEA